MLLHKTNFLYIAAFKTEQTNYTLQRSASVLLMTRL